MYDLFSVDYDRFVDWPSRLNFEVPFLLTQINTIERPKHASLRVLDAACGTGWHAIALAQSGYRTAGADLSSAMIERARHNAAGAGMDVRFETAGFGSLAGTFGERSCDALLCLGNSLPHLLSQSVLQAALEDFSRCLATGGLLILQNRNFDQVLAQRQRWMEPQSHREDGAEWLFLRFYDFDPDGLITFNIITLQRQGEVPWAQEVHSTRLRPLLQSELLSALQEAGFTSLKTYGSLGGEPFDPATSGNLVIKASR
jgi:glycine/sarcosine N-methyltransferase